MSIHSLAMLERNCTDKQDSYHTFMGENYLHVYERYFAPIRRKPLRILEIGVLDGKSLRLWRDYFPASLIFGLDIDPGVAINEDRISTFTGSQADPAVLAGIVNQVGDLDIVIDDGSHIEKYVAVSMRELLPHTRRYYCIEDTHCFIHGIPTHAPGMSLNPEADMQTQDSSEYESMITNMRRDMDTLSGRVRAVHFHPMQTIVQIA